MNMLSFQRVAITFGTCAFILSSCLGPRSSVHIDEDDVPDATHTIIVHTKMDTESAYREVEQLLKKWGYLLRTDTEITEGVSSDFYGIAERWDANYIRMRLAIVISGDKNAEVSIRGWYTARQYEDQPTDQPIIKQGYSGSIGREAWIEMFSVASEIDGVMRFE